MPLMSCKIGWSISVEFVIDWLHNRALNSKRQNTNISHPIVSFSITKKNLDIHISIFISFFIDLKAKKVKGGHFTLPFCVLLLSVVQQWKPDDFQVITGWSGLEPKSIKFFGFERTHVCIDNIISLHLHVFQNCFQGKNFTVMSEARLTMEQFWALLVSYYTTEQ